MAQEYIVTFSGEDPKDEFPRAPKVTVTINQYWVKETKTPDELIDKNEKE